MEKSIVVLLLLLSLSSCYMTGPGGSFSFETSPNRYDFYTPYYYSRPYYHHDLFYYPRRPNIIVYPRFRYNAPRRESLQSRDGYQMGVQAPIRRFPKKDD